jgi:hypothetical protein
MLLNKKRKLIVGGVVVLTSVALISTGFASWALASQATGETTTNVEFAAIESGSLDLTIDDASHSFVFGPDPNDNQGRVKYNASDEQAEALSVVITGTITDAKSCDSISFSVEAVPASDEVTTTAVTEILNKNYFTINSVTTIENVYSTTSGTTGADGITGLTGGDNADTIATWQKTVSLSWGSAFDNKNPSIYFDESNIVSSVSLGDKDDVATNMTVYGIMNTLKADIEKLAFKITVTATPK